MLHLLRRQPTGLYLHATHELEELAVARELGQKCLMNRSALDIPALHESMRGQVRNDGSRGIASMAISALDVALWDLKGKLLHRSVVDLPGAAKPAIAVYGSGGFTTYSPDQLAKQLSGWVSAGIKSVKMKIGARPDADLDRVRQARSFPRWRSSMAPQGSFTTRAAFCGGMVTPRWVETK